MYTVCVTICKFLGFKPNIYQECFNFNPDKDLCKSGKSATWSYIQDRLSTIIGLRANQCTGHVPTQPLTGTKCKRSIKFNIYLLY